MKESMGEANLTIVAVILVTTVVVIATPLIRSLLKRQAWRTCCVDQGGVVKGTKCTIYDNHDIVAIKNKEEMIDENNSCIQIHF